MLAAHRPLRRAQAAVLVVLAVLVAAVAFGLPTGAEARPIPVASNVKATAASSTITLSWGAPTSGSTSGYNVGRDGVDSTGYGAWQTSSALSASTYSFTFTSLVPGTTYHVWVQPVGGGVTTLSVTTSSSGVTNVQATSTSSSITVSWGAPTSGSATGYNAGRDGVDSTGYGAWQTPSPLSASTTSFTFTALVPSTQYHVWVAPVGGPTTTIAVTTAASGTSSASPTTTTTAAPAPTTTTTAPASTGKPLVGAYVRAINTSGLAAFGQHTQKTPLVGFDFLDGSSWSGLTSPNWLLDPWTTWLKANSARKLVLSVPMLVNGYAGQWDNTSLDTNFQQLAANIASRGITSQVILRLGWEMNGNWFPWGGSDYAGFIRMWRRIVPEMRAYGPFKFDWCPNGFDANVPNYYPGNDVVDYVGTDTYDIVWQHAGGDPNWRWSIVGQNVQNQYNFAAAHGKQGVLDEWAVWTASDTTQGGGGDDPTYVTNMLQWANNHGYLYTAYFDVSDGGVGTTLEQNPNSLQAYINNA